MLDRFGRKPIAIISNVSMTVLIFVVGALTAGMCPLLPIVDCVAVSKRSKVYGTSTNESGIYGTVAGIFLFQGVYSLAWTPLIMLYPPEILTYSMRVFGVGFMELLGNIFGLFIVFIFPFAFEAIGWKFFMINGAWDVLEVAFVAYFWIETANLSLEQIDQKFQRLYGKAPVVEGQAADGDSGSLTKVDTLFGKKE